MSNIKTISLCAPPRCHCPELEMDMDTCTVELRDDYNGKVKLTFEEMTILARRFLEYV